MTSGLSRWQRPDGWPTDEYFGAVEAELRRLGVDYVRAERDEDWEYRIALWEVDEPVPSGTSWLVAGWLVDEHSTPEQFGTLAGDVGWHWVPGGPDPREALGRFIEPFGLPYLADPAEVALAIARLVSEHPSPHA